MDRLWLSVLLCIALAACDGEGESSLTAPATPPDVSSSLQDATTGGSAGFYFLPPIAGNPHVGGQADLTRSPRVVICEVYHAATETCGKVLKTYQDNDITIKDESYQLIWSGSETGVVLDWPYRVSIHVGSFELGHVEVKFVKNGWAARASESGSTFVGTERSVPIRFRIEEGALIAAVAASECGVDGTTILDCDVQEATQNTETTAEVRDGNGNLAGLVILPPGAVLDNALVVMKLLANPIQGTTIDVNDQIPFFLRVKVTDLDGNDLTLGEKATLVVCQDPGVHASGLSTYEMLRLKIFRLTSAQQTEILDTNVGDPRCTGFTESMSAQRPSSFLGRLRADFKSSVAFLFGAQPLNALHGGLNTTLQSFSDFGAVVIESTPIGYGSTWDWSSALGAESGLSPFTTTTWGNNCPDLTTRRPFGTADAWPLGSDTNPSVITLTKNFTLPASATGVTVWAAIDNDIRVFVNDVDVTGQYQVRATTSANTSLVNGWLRHETCARLDAYSFPVTHVNPGGVNTLVVEARDRGIIGFVDVRIEEGLPPTQP